MGRMEYDILFVGAGPASLASAHRLVDLAIKENVPVRIAVLEKSKSFGAHTLSGAVSNPRAIKKLFPNYESNGFPLEGTCTESYLTVLGSKRAWNIPSLLSPPEMKKNGYLILSISDVTAWMAANLEEKVKDHPAVALDLYKGFPASEVIYENGRVAGVRVDNTGDASKDNCYAKLTIFGDKGFLSRDVIKKYGIAESPQTWAVGVKEVWETEKDFSGKVWHTMGYPLLDGTFGGGFIYGLKNNKLAIGVVAGLDAENPNLRPPQILQSLKKHPFVQDMIRGGKISRYGAALIPEGGYYALPSKFSVDGAMIIGDALGVLDVKGFSGVDKAMESGIAAAEAAFDALRKKDFSESALSTFKKSLMDGWVGKELYSSRHYRYAFHYCKDLFRDTLPAFTKRLDASGPLLAQIGTLAASPALPLNALSIKKIMDGKSNLGKIAYKEDRAQNRPDFAAQELEEPQGYDRKTIYSTADIVFYATTHYHEENSHIDEFNADTCKKCIKQHDDHGKDAPCVGDCTAEVHEAITKDGVRSHHMNLENCVQCRTCEIICPYENLRVNPAVYGSGPDFSGL